VEQARGGRFKRLHLQLVVMWQSVPGLIVPVKDMSAMRSPSLAEVPWMAVGGGMAGKTCNQYEYVVALQ